MKDTSFIKVSFALPLLLPALGWILCSADALGNGPLSNFVALVALPLIPPFSLPYAAFAIVAVASLWRRSLDAHLALGLASPPLFGGVLTLLSGWLLFETNATRARVGLPMEERSPVNLVWMGPALLWGYAYVGLALSLRAVAKRLRLISP
jgi:hypothetical protein